MGDFVTSANAQYLDSIPAEDYARTDIDETFEKKVYFGNDYYINNSGAGINISTDNDDSIARFQNNELKMKRPIELYSQSDSNYSVTPAMKIWTSFVGQSPDGQKTEFRFRSTDGSSIVGIDSAVSIQHHSNSSVNVGIDIEGYVNNFRRQDPDTGNYYEIAPQPLSTSDAPTFGGLAVNGNATLGSNNELFVDDTSGNVGIGTTGPSSKLDVNGGLTVNGNATLGSNNELFVDDTSGNVGIGTSSPASTLHVRRQGAHLGTHKTQENDYMVGYFGSNIGWNGTQWTTQSDSANNGAGLMAADINGNLGFYTFSSTGGTDKALTDTEIAAHERMTIIGNGNVGIGTTSPSELLNVNGTAQMNSIKLPNGSNSHTLKTYLSDLFIEVNGVNQWRFLHSGSNSQAIDALDGWNSGTGTNAVISQGSLVKDAGSSKRFKSNIQPAKINIDSVLSIEPMHYYHEQIEREEIGLIAEHVAGAGFDEYVNCDSDGKIESLSYERLVTIQQAVLRNHNQRLRRIEKFSIIGLISLLIGWFKCFVQPIKE